MVTKREIGTWGVKEEGGERGERDGEFRRAFREELERGASRERRTTFKKKRKEKNSAGTMYDSRIQKDTNSTPI
jgi:hypothetical protein